MSFKRHEVKENVLKIVEDEGHVHEYLPTYLGT